MKPQSAHMQDFNTDLPLATFLYTLWFINLSLNVIQTLKKLILKLYSEIDL